jgi:hypothetical protein
LTDSNKASLSCGSKFFGELCLIDVIGRFDEQNGGGLPAITVTPTPRARPL